MLSINDINKAIESVSSMELVSKVYMNDGTISLYFKLGNRGAQMVLDGHNTSLSISHYFTDDYQIISEGYGLIRRDTFKKTQKELLNKYFPI